MVTQVIFNIDKKLKDQAMAKAQHNGIAFSAILKLATQAFVDGDLSLELVHSEKFNVRTSREMRNALKDISQGKNVSSGFTSAKAIANFLKE